MGDTHRYADKSCAEDADKQRARHILDNEHRGEDDAYNTKQGGTRCKVTDAYKRSRVFYNDARILQSDKGNEESDAGSDGFPSAVGVSSAFSSTGFALSAAGVSTFVVTASAISIMGLSSFIFLFLFSYS